MIWTLISSIFGNSMFFDFNFYSSLLLPAVFQGLIMSYMLFIRGIREERLSDKMLAFLVLLCNIKVAFWMFGFAGWYDSHDAYTSFMFYFPFETVIWIGPTLYFYFISLTDANFKFSKTHLPHFILPLISLTLTMAKFLVDFTFYSPFPVEAWNQYGTKGPWADLLRSTTFQVISYLSFFFYLVMTLKLYNRYRLYIRENFSAIGNIEFEWIRNILYAIGAGMIIFLLFELNGILFPGNNSFKIDWYAYFCMGVIVFYISISGLLAGNRNLHMLHFPAQPGGDSSPVDQKAQPFLDEDLKSLLTNHLLENKPYLEPELSLNELAQQLRINPVVLSKLINEGFNQNFNDFINEYRIRELMGKLKNGEHKNQTLLGLALDSGFNSKATFNRAFKKLTSMSPKEWIHQNVSI
jgi:AraC-like DNA-binding protein